MMFDETFIKEMSSIDAYNYGRQEAEKELNEIHLCECNQIRADAIDEFETRILGNCSLMLKDGERVIVIRQDIFKFIIEQMQKGKENDRF